MFNIDNLKDVPHKPGCYLWKDINNEIIYVGKAKDLNKRMHQYFLKSQNLRISKLVNTIDAFDFIVVNNENEALILENNLIKKYQPKFNVLLKNGNNNYPYILVTNETNPRILYTRKYNPKRGKYYGPFASNDAKAYDLYVYLNKLFPLRKCNQLPNKKCIYYDLNQCLGPCINKIDNNKYEDIIKQIDDLFNNENKQIINDLKQNELLAAQKLDFEKADYFLKLQTTFKNIISHQIVELSQKVNADYIGYYYDNNQLSINIFNYVNGKLISKNEIIQNIYTLDIQEAILSYLIQYYSEIKLPNIIYISLDENNIELLKKSLNVSILKPQKGIHFELLLQAIKNSTLYYQKNQLKTKYDNLSIIEDLAKLLNIKSCEYIEMIDNANLFLENNVAGLVVFKNGLPFKQMYRHFNLTTIDNKSDYQFMYEVVYRRYSRLLKQNDLLPNLLILDGGINQINAALKVLNELNINTIKVIGLVKNNKHQTDKILLDNNQEILIDKKSNIFLFLTKIQNEVHNFAINFYRNKNIKSKLSTFLDNINGIGNKTKQKILNAFPNIYDLKKASLSTLEQIVNKKIAKEIFDKLKDM